MKTRFGAMLIFLAASLSVDAAAMAVVTASPWENSVVTVEVRRKQFDYYQPWNQRTRRDVKVGVVVGRREVLASAADLSDQTLIRLQKGGHGKWWIGAVVWVDHHANLAVLTVTNDAFWSDLKALPLSSKMPAGSTVEIVRWNDGNLESRKAEFTRFVVRQSRTSGMEHMQLEVSSEIQKAGGGEAVIAGSHLIGIVVEQADRICHGLPASFIQPILEAHRKGNYRGLGYFHFYWQTAQNSVSLAHLGLPGEPRGVLVTRVPDLPDGSDPVLQPRDVILQIDGFDLDTDGNYQDPEFGQLNLENLATRRKWAGDHVQMKIWRQGKPLDITYRLPKYEYTNWLVAYANYDQAPEYFIIGGLVFQPLTRSYLREWGNEWESKAPFRFNYYTTQPPQKNQPSLIILSQVLPDPYNMGYQEQKYLAVEKVNGQLIGSLSDLRNALQKAPNGFHTVDFVPGNSWQRIVLAAGEAEQQATRRVLERYGIAESFHISSSAPSPVAGGPPSGQ